MIEATRKHADFIAAACVDARLPVARGDALRRCGQLLDWSRYAGRNPQAAQDGEQDAARGDAIGDVADVLLRFDHAGARDGHGQYSKDIALTALKRNGGCADTVFAAVSEVEDGVRFLTCLEGRTNQVFVARGVGHLARGTDQPLWIEDGEVRAEVRLFSARGLVCISIEGNLHSGCDWQIGEERFVEAYATHEANGQGADRSRVANGAVGKEAQGGSPVGQVLSIEKRGLVFPSNGFNVTEARRPLRGADDLSIRADNFEEVQLRILGQRLRLSEIRRWVAGLDELERHGVDMFACGNVVDRRRDLGRSMLELALKLADHEGRLLAITLVEDIADAHQHGPRYRGHGSGHGEREQKQKLLAQAHGTSSSETPASNGTPSGLSRRSRTRPLEA